MLSKYYFSLSPGNEESVNVLLIDLRALKVNVMHRYARIRRLLSSLIQYPLATRTFSKPFLLIQKQGRVDPSPRQDPAPPAHPEKAGETGAVSSVSSYSKGVWVCPHPPRNRFFSLATSNAFDSEGQTCSAPRTEEPSSPSSEFSEGTMF